MQGSAAATPSLEPREWALLALLGISLAPALLSLSEVWREVDYQSHGFLVPVVSLWVALRERYAWRRLAPAPDARGLALLGIAFAGYLLGLGIASVPLQGVAFVAALLGPAAVRPLAALPLAMGAAVLGFRPTERYGALVVDGALLAGALLALAWASA